MKSRFLAKSVGDSLKLIHFAIAIDRDTIIDLYPHQSKYVISIFFLDWQEGKNPESCLSGLGMKSF